MTMATVMRRPTITMRMFTIRIVAMSWIIRIDSEMPRTDGYPVTTSLA
jgi:hypothetical protein